MILFENVESEEDWGFAREDGTMFMSDSHVRWLTPFSVWKLCGVRVAVFYAGLSLPADRLDTTELPDAVDAILVVDNCDWDNSLMSFSVVSLGKVDPSVLAVAGALACAEDGRLDVCCDTRISSEVCNGVVRLMPGEGSPGWSASFEPD